MIYFDILFVKSDIIDFNQLHVLVASYISGNVFNHSLLKDHNKIKMRLSFTHHHFILDVHDFLSSDKQKQRFLGK